MREPKELKKGCQHNLKWQMIEEVFFNEPLLLVENFKHSQNEFICFALGITDAGEKLFVVFTARDNKIRVIRARILAKSL